MRQARTTTLTPGAPHVRDAVDLAWVMRTFLVALAPCVLFGLYNTGYQANFLEHGLEPASSWRDTLLGWVGAGRDPSSVTDCFLLGALYFVPLLALAVTVGAVWEWIFARARQRDRAPGLAVTAALFTASLPPTLPWWQAVLGISFGIVVGKEIFGGTGRNVFNPAVVGLAFLYFAYPAAGRGDAVWSAVDGITWTEAFLGRIPGAMGETSTLGCILGALFLVHQRVASWRILLGSLLGAAATGALLPGPSWSWHLVLGSLAFGAVFFATDPVTSAATDAGRWVYGVMIGFLVVLIRVANPVHGEGVLFAILFGNISAPLIDHIVIGLHVRRRRRRLGRA